MNGVNWTAPRRNLIAVSKSSNRRSHVLYLSVGLKHSTGCPSPAKLSAVRSPRNSLSNDRGRQLYRVYRQTARNVCMCLPHSIMSYPHFHRSPAVNFCCVYAHTPQLTRSRRVSRCTVNRIRLVNRWIISPITEQPCITFCYSELLYFVYFRTA